MTKDAKTQRRFTNSRTPQAPLKLRRPFSKELTQQFYQWISQRQCDMEAEIVYLSAKHNRLALEIMRRQQGALQASGRLYFHLFSRRTTTLWHRWNQLDCQIRLLKHIEKMMAPVYFLSVQYTEEIPEGDPIIEFFLDEFTRENQTIAVVKEALR